MKISIVIPAYNEESTLGSVLEEIRNHMARQEASRTYEVIVVDDGSTDRTAEAAGRFPEVVLIRHHRNRGYGAALKAGIAKAAGTTVFIMDADGQHAPGEMEKLMPALADYDMVVGSRPPGSGGRSPGWRRPGKWLLGKLANYLAGDVIPDLNSGFRVFRRDLAAKYLHLCPTGFSFTTTLTMAFLCQGHQVAFLPIEINSRHPRGKSTVTVHTGLATFLLMIRLIALFGPLKIFLPASGSFLIAGFLWAVPYLFAGKGLSVASLLLIITGVLLFFFGLLTDQVASLRRERYE
jgi:glycosyltransferase involved in cell wall biosynthesis